MVEVKVTELKRALVKLKRTTLGESKYLPIVHNVMVGATEEGVVRLTTTNLSTATTVEVASEGAGGWIATVKAHTLSKLLQGMKGVVSLEAITNDDGEDEGMNITSGPATVALAGITWKEFPIVPELAGPSWEIKAQTLRDVFSRALYAVANDDRRPALSGMLVQPETRYDGSRLYVAGANGFVLSRQIVPLDDAPEVTGNMIVPRGTIDTLIKNFGKAPKGSVTIKRDDKGASFEWEGATVTTQLIEGNFPDVERLIPTNQDMANELLLNTAEVLQAAKVLAPLVRDQANITILKVHGDMSLTLSDIHDATTIKLTGTGDTPMEIAINVAYLIEVASSIGCEEMLVDLQSGSRPILITCSSMAGQNNTHVVMPMHIGGRDK